MVGSLPTRHFAFSKYLLHVGILLGLTGCGFFSAGKSDYERFQDRQKAFGGVIADAGGVADLGEQSKMGFKVTGWTINLSGGKVTDAIIDKMIEAARGAPVLDLNLSGTEVTDDQLVKLDKGGALTKTVNLDLSNTAISDKGLDGVNAAVILSELNLEGSQATKEGAARLGKRKIANPNTPAPFKTAPKVKI